MKKVILSSIFIFTFLYTHVVANDKIINIDTLNTSDKQIMIFFHMNNCSYCNRMDTKTLQERNIKVSIEKSFLLVDINIDNGDKITFNNTVYRHKVFANNLDVKFFPTVLFLDKENEITYKVRGYRTIEKFQHILNYMEAKEFEQMSFFEYLETLEKE